MIETSIQFDQRGLNDFGHMLRKLTDVCGYERSKAVRIGGIMFLKSMRAATKKSALLRRVVRNPDASAKNDGRKGKFGVFKWDYKDNKYFDPIYRTGEYGKIRFKNKKTAEWLVRDRITGKVTRQQWETGTGEFQLAGIMQSKKRIIGRSGLARASWGWAMHELFQQGSPGVAFARPSGAITTQIVDNAFDYAVIINNKLNYIMSALNHSGDHDVKQASAKAAVNLRKHIERKLEAARS